MIITRFYVAAQNRVSGHSLLTLIGFFLELPYSNFGTAIKLIETTVYLRYSKSAEVARENKYANEHLDKRKITPMIFNRSKAKLSVNYISNVSPAEIELFDESTDAATFSKFCSEFIDNLTAVRQAIKKTDDLRIDDLLVLLADKKRQLPVSEDVLKSLRKQMEAFVWPAQHTESMQKSPIVPKTIPIPLDEEIEFIGTYRDGLFWAHVIEGHTYSCTVDTHANNFVYSVLHVFDKSGTYKETKFEKTLHAENEWELANRKLEKLLSELPSSKFQPISIELFETKIDGMSFGMIDESDEEANTKVVMVPEGFVFYPPWNGQYDT